MNYLTNMLSTTSDKVALAMHLKEQKRLPFSLLNLAVGNPDLLPPAEALQALSKSATEPRAHQYTSNKGNDPFRKAALSWMATTHATEVTNLNQLLPMQGAKAAIYLISGLLLQPGDEVLVPNPGYPLYNQIAQNFGATSKSYRVPHTHAETLDLTEIKRVCSPATKAIWINTLQMPTGRILAPETIKQLEHFCRTRNIWLLNDNPYAMLSKVPVPNLSHKNGAYKRAVSVITLSKTFNIPGWRMAFIIGAPDFISQLQTQKNLLYSGHFAPLEEAAKACFNTPMSWITHQQNEYEKRKLRTYHLLDALRCSYEDNQQGMYVWAKLPEFCVDDQHFCKRLLHQTGIWTAPGSNYGSEGKGYIRVALTASTSQITDAINRINNHFRHEH
ncbi:MAG: pyridoxal phosphate-dependent aminotransferase [Bacteroidota bacterium]